MRAGAGSARSPKAGTIVTAGMTRAHASPSAREVHARARERIRDHADDRGHDRETTRGWSGGPA